MWGRVFEQKVAELAKGLFGIQENSGASVLVLYFARLFKALLHWAG